MSEPDEVHKNISESADKIRVETKVKRGTGTRDQDTTKVVTRHPDPAQAAANHQSSIEAVRAAADAARSIQPGEEDA